MRTLSTILLGFAFAGPTARADDAVVAVDKVFAAWRSAAQDVQSLVVEYRSETRNRIVNGDSDTYDYVFKIIKCDDGWLASLNAEPAIPAVSAPKRMSYLLYNQQVYLLNHDDKMATRFGASTADLPGFLARHFNPFVVVLNRKRADEWCRFEIVKKDEWYTYLSVKPRDPRRADHFDGNFEGGGIAVMNEDSPAVPKGMPRTLYQLCGALEIRTDIRTWKLNAPNPPKPEEFTRPEDRPGWTVGPWPFAAGGTAGTPNR
jgi:hypothetical protein